MWTFELCSRTGAQLTPLELPAKLRFELNGKQSIALPLDYANPAATKLYEQLAAGMPRLRAYRYDSLDDPLRFSGLWAPQEERTEAGEEGQPPGAELNFTCPLGWLEHRFTGPDAQYTADDAGAIAWALIVGTTDVAAAMATDVAEVGLARGSIEPTKVRDRGYQRKQIAEAIQQLTGVIDGFDFHISPLEGLEGGPIGRFDVHGQLGSDRSQSVRLEHGLGTLANVDRIERQIVYPVNRAIAVGAAADGTAIEQIAEDLASQAKYGVWEKVETWSDVSELPTLLDKARAMLRPELEQIVRFTPNPAVAPQPWEDYWLGDTLAFLADQDALQINGAARATAIEIDVDEHGNESAHHITYGEQRMSTLPTIIRELRQRLATVEQPRA